MCMHLLTIVCSYITTSPPCYHVLHSHLYMCYWVVHHVHPVCLFWPQLCQLYYQQKKVHGPKHTGSLFTLCYDKFINIVTGLVLAETHVLFNIQAVYGSGSYGSRFIHVRTHHGVGVAVL